MHPQPSLPIFFHVFSRFDKLQQLCFPLNCAIVSNPAPRAALPWLPRTSCGARGIFLARPKDPSLRAFRHRALLVPGHGNEGCSTELKRGKFKPDYRKGPRSRMLWGNRAPHHCLRRLQDTAKLRLGHGRTRGHDETSEETTRCHAWPWASRDSEEQLLGAVELCLRAADESVRSLRLSSIQATSWWGSATDHMLRTK